ncbi:hypothetical protein [Streptomyces sp. CLCI03]
MPDQKRSTAAGRELWRELHPTPTEPGVDTDDADQSEGRTNMDRGRQMWLRRKAGGVFALGPEPLAPDVTPDHNDAA